MQLKKVANIAPIIKFQTESLSLWDNIGIASFQSSTQVC